MRLTVNGETLETSNAATITELLKEIRIEPYKVAVEVNLSIIRFVGYGIYDEGSDRSV
jgi:thiamine biosynthesis protein ThiS